MFPRIAQCCHLCLQFWPWHARWCIKYVTVFIEVLKNGQNWGKKLIFWLILWVCLFMPSYTLWITPQDFAKWKTLLRYISVVSIISIAYEVVKLFEFFWLLFLFKLWIAYNRTFTYTFWIPSSSFWVFAILNFTQKKQLFFGSWPYWAHFDGFWAVTPVSNVKLSWNFDHSESS